MEAAPSRPELDFPAMSEMVSAAASTATGTLNASASVRSLNPSEGGTPLVVLATSKLPGVTLRVAAVPAKFGGGVIESALRASANERSAWSNTSKPPEISRYLAAEFVKL